MALSSDVTSQGGSDELTVERGATVPIDPEISIVVMSIDSNPFSGEAIDSLLAQKFSAEIILVNTGKDTLRNFLGERLAKIVLVESRQKRLPGGTRNLGLLQAHAPVIAFLAADGLAVPGWIAARLAAHAEGAEAVASALLPAPDASGSVSTASLAMFAFLHSRRWPGAAPEHAPRYGASYLRSTLDRIGPFKEDLRIGEDTEMNGRLAVPPVWCREVLTLQRYPATAAEVWHDAAERAHLNFEWNRERRRPPVLRAIWRVPSGMRNAAAFFMNADRQTRAALLRAAPFIVWIALASAFGAVRAALRR